MLKWLVLVSDPSILWIVLCVSREGTNWLEQMLVKMEKGEADTREIPMLEEISRQIEGHTICALGDAAAWPVQVCWRFSPL